jgi:hypothetical protein
MIGSAHRAEGHTFKVCICGQQGVGKTALLHRRISGSFGADYRPTIASGFGPVVESVGDRPVTLNIWDTAGQEKYQSMMPLYLRNCECVILVLDITAPASWDFVNKADLEPAMERDDITDWATDLGYRIYQTSAFSGAGITQLFTDVAAALVTVKTERAVGKEELMEDQQKTSGRCC